MSHRARSIAIAVVCLLITAGTFQNCAEKLPDTSTSAPSVATNEGVVAGQRVKVRLASAKQSADISSSGTNWKDIPGTSVTFTLSKKLTAEFRANGSASTLAGANYGSTHCGIRFVINGHAYGNPTWGDVIVGVSACSATASCHSAWTATREIDLEPGTHTVQLQVTGWPGADSSCVIAAADYAAARLAVEGY